VLPVASAVALNAVTLLGVIAFGWPAGNVFVLFWVENAVLGAWNVVRIVTARGDGRGERPVRLTVNGRPTAAGPVPLALFFCVHYGVFWVVHGIFVLTLPQFQTFGGESAGIANDPGAVAFVLIGLAISHGVSYRFNYIGRGEYLRTSVSAQMSAPYGRLMILHITIIVGGVAIAMTGAPSAAVLILVLLKTALDLGLHLAEHRLDVAPSAPAQPRQEALR
jgi:hypothetical protein